MSVVDSVVACMSKHMKKVNLMLNGLTTHRDKKRKLGNVWTWWICVVP